MPDYGFGSCDGRHKIVDCAFGPPETFGSDMVGAHGEVGRPRPVASERRVGALSVDARIAKKPRPSRGFSCQ
jgi:hypothetical protein